MISQATLNTSISLTEESLPEDIKEFFRWLVVFDDDTDIKLETLATIWDMTIYDAMDIMRGERLILLLDTISIIIIVTINCKTTQSDRGKLSHCYLPPYWLAI